MRLFRKNIAPTGGNADALRSGLVNLMYYAHKVHINKFDSHPRVMKKLDVMYFIYQEMYLGIQDKQKAPIYAPYIMRLLKNSGVNSPLLYTELVSYTPAKPQRKIITFKKGKAPTTDPETSSPPRARRKNATPSRFVPSQHDTMKEEVGKASFMEKMFMCMGLSMRRSMYQGYKDQRAANKKVNERLGSLTPVEQHSPTPATSSHTLSYGAWNQSQGCTLSWIDMEYISSGIPKPHGKGPATDEDLDDDPDSSDEEENEEHNQHDDSEDDEDNEDDEE